MPPPSQGCVWDCASTILICLIPIIIVGTIVVSALFFLTDPASRSPPISSITNLYIPALDISLNSTTNHTIYFDLKLLNDEMFNGLIYDPLNLTFSYSATNFRNNNLSAIANFTFPGFYQGYAKTAHRRGLAETHYNSLLGEGEKLVMNSLASLRIELRTAVKFKNIFGRSGRRRVRLGAKVEINQGGQMVGKNKKVVKNGLGLTADYFSGAIPSFGGYYVHMIVFSSTFILAFN